MQVNFTIFILTLLLIITVIGLTVWLILSLKGFKKLAKSKKGITNLLYKFCNNHQTGNLIKKDIVGKNKELSRLTYLTKELDEYGEEQTRFYTIIGKNNRLIETDQVCIVLPKSNDDIEDKGLRKLANHVDNISDEETKNEALRNWRKKLNDNYKESLGDVFSDSKLKRNISLTKELMGTEEKKPEEPKS